MAKVLQGKVIANKMHNTAIIEVVRLVPHPLYRKLLKRSKKFKVETGGRTLEVGAVVKIIETRPLAKDKHFKLEGVDLSVRNVAPVVSKPEPVKEKVKKAAMPKAKSGKKGGKKK